MEKLPGGSLRQPMLKGLRYNFAKIVIISFPIAVLLYESIRQYLDYLSMLGFISKLYYQEADVLCSHCITPPNTTKATQLKAILDRVDIEACDINDQIEAMLYPVQEDAKLKKEEVIKNQGE